MATSVKPLSPSGDDPYPVKNAPRSSNDSRPQKRRDVLAKMKTAISGPVMLGVLLLLTVPVSLFAQSQPLKHGLTPVYGKPMSPELDLPGLDGTRHVLSQYRGHAVVVNFWATWCPPCIEELPALQHLWDRLRGENFEILAVNLGEEKPAVEAFLAGFAPQLRFPILLNFDQSIMDRWKIQALPTSYIVDTRGRWAYQALGPRDFSHDHIVDRIRLLMAEQ